MRLCRRVELVQIEKKSLLASRTATDFMQQDLARTHAARDSGPDPIEQVVALGSTKAGGRPQLRNSDGRQRFQRKSRKDILDCNTGVLISAVESRCIRAIERALGGAGWFGLQQALRGILGTLFWRKT